MVALMPKSGKSKSPSDRPRGSGQRAAGRKDVFARLDEGVVDKLDDMVEAMRPRTTRSALIAQLIEEFVSAKWPEHERKKSAQGN